jgi:hypothetical protein
MLAISARFALNVLLAPATVPTAASAEERTALATKARSVGAVLERVDATGVASARPVGALVTPAPE